MYAILGGVMEFDPPQKTNSAVSDDERIAAETRQKTLNPMNPFIKPEDIPDPIAVNTPQANIQRDSEDTAQAESLLQPSSSAQPITPPSQLNKGRTVLIAFALAVPAAVILIVLMLPKTQ